MRRKMLLLSAAVVVTAILAATTMAYFTAIKTAENTITAGNVQLEIRNTSASGDQVVHLKAGDTVDKAVTVENTGGNPFYLRMRLTSGVEKSDLTAEECLSLDLNVTDWTYRDGYYYYNYPLNPGETAKPLLARMHVEPAAAGSRYRNKVLTLNLAASAVQSKNNGTTPLEAGGWPDK